MTSSELKYLIESSGKEPHFFSRSTMRFFGDSMRNYGVRLTTIDTYSAKGLPVYELYRRRSVKHGLKSSAYFNQQTFQLEFPKRGE